MPMMPNQRVDDDIAHEPDWAEYVESWHCYHCDGNQTFIEYDPIDRAVKVRCEECGIEEWCSTEPDPDGRHDRD